MNELFVFVRRGCSLQSVALYCSLIGLFLFVFTPALSAQGFGAIQGTVIDSSGAVVPDATIVATQADTSRTVSVSTNGSGFYVFPKLPPAHYSVSATARGFENFIQSGVELQVDQSLTLNFGLVVGTAEHVVTVVANAEQINLTNGTLSQVVDEKRINDLPLNGRNAAQLTTLVAGAVVGPTDGSDQGVTKSFPSVVNVSVNGSRVYQMNYLLNGGNNVDEYTNVNGPFPFPDALQEFSVQTSNYSAQYGQNAGGVVNIITKSGTNQYHGVLFEYLRNRVFNAASYFGYQNGIKTTDPLKRNQFGGTFSGPVAIPQVFRAKNTFFFFGYQKTIIRTQQNGLSAFVPTDAERAGDFSALLTVNPNNPIGKVEQLHKPNNANAIYPNNQVNPNTFDLAAVKFLNTLPHATGNGKVLYTAPTAQDFDEYFARVDNDFGQKDHIFAHYYSNHFVNAGVSDTSNLLTYADESDIIYRSALIAETHTFTSSLVNNFLVNYLQEVSNRGPAPGAPSVTDFGVNIWQPEQRAIQRMKATGYFTIGANPFAAFQRNNYTLSEDMHWVHGNHNFSFGVHAEISKADINSLYQQPGLFTFANKNTGDAIASLMLGSLNSFVQGSGQFYNGRNTFLGFYAEDSWKATRRLTLNYGLRYEPYLPWAEIEGRTEQFNQAAYNAGVVSSVFPNAPKGLLFPGDPGVPAQGFNAIYTHFMPRVGFAYDVFGDGKTALRGGAGIFYDTRIEAAYNANAGQVSPFSVSLTLTNPSGPFSDPYLGITNPFPAPTPLPHNLAIPQPVQVYTFDSNGSMKPPVTYEWNLAIEQQLSNTLMSRIAYVGSQSPHNMTMLELNPAQYNGTGTDGPRIRPEYSNITNLNTGANDSYHSLQATLQQRLFHGITVLANYTWSKSIDDLPYNPGASLSYVFPVSQPNFRRLDRGPSDFDRSSVFSGSYVWDLPALKSGPSVLRYIVSHWETSGIVQIQSGDPLTVTSSADNSNTAIGQDRAVYKGGNPYNRALCTPGPCAGWINAAAFSNPALGTFGNVQKSAFRGPGYVDWDAGIYRIFPVYERSQLQFRAEYFNVLNHTNFGDPISDVNAAGFGTITSLGNYNPRLAQLSLKLMF